MRATVFYLRGCILYLYRPVNIQYSRWTVFLNTHLILRLLACMHVSILHVHNYAHTHLEGCARIDSCHAGAHGVGSEGIDPRLRTS